MTHVRTAPYYPQSNGKLERFHKSIKKECIRPQTPLTLDDDRRIIEKYIDYYNNQRLHSAIGYITPMDKMEGRDKEIWATREKRLAEARERREQARKRREEPALKEEEFILGSRASDVKGKLTRKEIYEDV